jgi:hypothetical protein
MQYREGQTATNPKTGQKIVFQGGFWVEARPPTPTGAAAGDANIRGRVALGLPPSIEAERSLSGAERGGNPLMKDWGAAALSAIGWEGPARVVGGDDYQAYRQASKTFESSLMPIFSGSAVTPSEAERFISANLPQATDTPATLATKSRNRRMILNAAAEIAGKPLPFPDVPSWNGPQRMKPSARRMGEDRKRDIERRASPGSAPPKGYRILSVE